MPAAMRRRIANVWVAGSGPQFLTVWLLDWCAGPSEGFPVLASLHALTYLLMSRASGPLMRSSPARQPAPPTFISPQESSFSQARRRVAEQQFCGDAMWISHGLKSSGQRVRSTGSLRTTTQSYRQVRVGQTLRPTRHPEPAVGRLFWGVRTDEPEREVEVVADQGDASTGRWCERRSGIPVPYDMAAEVADRAETMMAESQVVGTFDVRRAGTLRLRSSSTGLTGEGEQDGNRCESPESKSGGGGVEPNPIGCLVGTGRHSVPCGIAVGSLDRQAAPTIVDEPISL